MHKFVIALFASISLVSLSASADENWAQQTANDYVKHAQALDHSFKPSAEDGRAFFVKKVDVNGKDLSCSACHTDNPAATGKHNETGKPIKPLAPSANPDRFADRSKSEKNFTKHCRDLYGKNCSVQDKANYVTYLLTVK